MESGLPCCSCSLLFFTRILQQSFRHSMSSPEEYRLVVLKQLKYVCVAP